MVRRTAPRGNSSSSCDITIVTFPEQKVVLNVRVQPNRTSVRKLVDCVETLGRNIPLTIEGMVLVVGTPMSMFDGEVRLNKVHEPCLTDDYSKKLGDYGVNEFHRLLMLVKRSDLPKFARQDHEQLQMQLAGLQRDRGEQRCRNERQWLLYYQRAYAVRRRCLTRGR